MTDQQHAASEPDDVPQPTDAELIEWVDTHTRPCSAALIRHPLTDEQLRILRAIAEGRMTTNSAGRYVIEGEARPDRKSRERLRGRGLIDHYYERGRGSHWRVTAKGKAVLHAE